MEEIKAFDIEPSIVDSVTDLFDTMLSVQVETGDPENLNHWDTPRIAGSVSFAGAIVGAVKVETTNQSARLMTAKMIGMEEDEIEGDDEVKDVILETCNIVAGSLKSALNDHGLSCVISSPTVTMGKNFGIETLNMARYEKFAFSYEDNSFLVEVCLKLDEEAPPEALKKLTSVDIGKFERLDIISSAGDTVIELFELMMEMKLDLSETDIVEDIEGGRVVGAVNFAGEVMGSISLQVSETFSRIITSKMMDIPLSDVKGEEQTKDVIGELCNIIGGNLKSGFCDSGLLCEMSPPSITIGDDFKLETLNMARYEQFAFRFYDHDIRVRVCVKIDENAKAASDEETDSASVDEPASRTTSAPHGAVEAKEPTEEGGADNALVSQDDIDALLSQAQNDTPPETQADAASEQPPAPADRAAPKASAPEPSANGNAQNEETGLDAAALNLDFILNIPVEISVELGRVRMPIGKAGELSPGSSLALSNVAHEDLSIFANNKLIAKGEVIVDHEKYGIRVTEVISRMDRIKSLGH